MVSTTLQRWVSAKDLHMGGQSSDLVELILRRVNGGATQPDPLIAELERCGVKGGAVELMSEVSIWRFPEMEFIVENLFKFDDLGVPPFMEISI